MSVQESRRDPKGRRRAVPKSGNSQAHSAHADPNVMKTAAVEAQARQGQRREQIATAAYFRAQQRGFEPGHELDDWLAAEAEIANPQASVVAPVEMSGSGSAA